MMPTTLLPPAKTKWRRLPRPRKTFWQIWRYISLTFAEIIWVPGTLAVIFGGTSTMEGHGFTPATLIAILLLGPLAYGTALTLICVGVRRLADLPR